MRIVDILGEPDESSSSTITTNGMAEIDGTGSAAQKKGKDDASSFFSSPSSSSSGSSWSRPSLKRVVSRWLVSVKRKKKRRDSGFFGKQKQNGGEWKGLGYCWDRTTVRKRREEEEGECDPSPSSPNPVFYHHRKKSIAGRNGDSLGSNFDGSSFNLGVGVALMFLFAKAANEYNKMIELRNQMETFFKESTQRKDGESCLTHPEQSVGNHTSSACSDASVDRISCSHITLSMHQSYNGDDQTSGSPMEGGDGGPNVVEEEPVNGRAMGMDQLEAELESELEQLQVNMEEEIEDDPRFVQHEDEVSFDNRDEEHADLGGKYEEQEWEHSRGVCPRELERRLHELLEARQQEQIQVLESDLREARRLLQEKEMEVYWRKNLALLPQSNNGSRSC